MADITIRFDDDQVRAMFQRLEATGRDTTPARREIGEYLVDSTKRRFTAGTAPDGSRWAPNSQATIEAFVGRYSGSYTKARGRLSKKGAERAMNKKPLVGESRTLSTQVFYQLTGEGLEWGSNHPGAAMQQWGGSKGDFPHLWGDIPAREFLGISDEDREEILAILDRHLEDGVGG